MKRLFVILIGATLVLGGTTACNKSTCPANGGYVDSQKTVKKHNKRKKPQSGLFPKDMRR